MPRSDKIVLTPKEIQALETMSAFRMPMQRMAAVLGISKKTLERMAAENEGENAVADAIEKGRGTASYNVTKTAYDMAISGKYPAMTMFWLKTQENWRETDRLELTGLDGRPIEVAQLSPEERRKRIEELLALRKKFDEAEKLPGE